VNSRGHRHYLHLARAKHQLALYSYDETTRRDNRMGKPVRQLEAARLLNEQAQSYAEHPSCANFSDPVLRYGIAVLRSLIESGLHNHSHAVEAAENAIRMIDDESLPPWIRGWAWTAKGRALASSVKAADDHKPIATDDHKAIEDAQLAFERVYRDATARPADGAAAHFYLSILFSKIRMDAKAQFHLEAGKGISKPLEYRWLRDLEADAEQARRSDKGLVCTFDIEDLVEKGKDWDGITGDIAKAVRDAVLRLKFEELIKADGVTKVAEKLKVSRATLYSWIKHSEVGKEIQDTRNRRAS
jgi:hypothetical protein